MFAYVDTRYPHLEPKPSFASWCVCLSIELNVNVIFLNPTYLLSWKKCLTKPKMSVTHYRWGKKVHEKNPFPCKFILLTSIIFLTCFFRHPFGNTLTFLVRVKYVKFPFPYTFTMSFQFLCYSSEASRIQGYTGCFKPLFFPLTSIYFAHNSRRRTSWIWKHLESNFRFTFNPASINSRSTKATHSSFCQNHFSLKYENLPSFQTQAIWSVYLEE